MGETNYRVCLDHVSEMASEYVPKHWPNVLVLPRAFEQGYCVLVMLSLPDPSSNRVEGF